MGNIPKDRVLSSLTTTSFIRDISYSYFLQLKYSNGANYYHEIIAKIYYFNLGTLVWFQEHYWYPTPKFRYFGPIVADWTYPAPEFPVVWIFWKYLYCKYLVTNTRMFILSRSRLGGYKIDTYPVDAPWLH